MIGLAVYTYKFGENSNLNMTKAIIAGLSGLAYTAFGLKNKFVKENSNGPPDSSDDTENLKEDDMTETKVNIELVLTKEDLEDFVCIMNLMKRAKDTANEEALKILGNLRHAFWGNNDKP